MSGFLGGLFGGSQVEQKSASGAAVGRAVSLSPSRYGMWSSTGTWDMDKATKDGWERVLWVFRCIDAIAVNQSAIPLVQRRGDERTGQIIDNPRLWKLLNIRPNIYETAAMFRYRVTTNALLSRKGAFIEIVGDPLSPESLHVLPPQSVEPIPHPLKFTDGFRVRGADQSETILANEQVIWIRLKPHPTDPYAQTTPLVSAGISAETDFLARLFNRNFLMADGRPGLLVSVRGQVGQGDAEELKRRFSGGPAQAGQTTVIEGEGLDVVDLSSSPRDAQWQEATRTSKEDILLAFGVPESILGNASGRTFDNADAEYEIFWTHTMLPHCNAIAAAFDVFTKDQRDDEQIVFDYSKVDVLQRQERRRQDAIIERWARGAITWNEMRDGIGLETWDDALAARIIVLPSGFAMAKNGDDQAKIMELPNVNAQPNPGEALSEVARAGALKGTREGARQLNNVLAARALMIAGSAKQDPVPIEAKTVEDDAVPFDDVVDAVVVHPYERERKTLEATLDGLLIGMSSRQEQIVSDRIMHAKVRKGTRHWEGETKARKPLDAAYVVEVDRWVDDMRRDFTGVLTPVLRREIKRALRDMTDNGIELDASISDITKALLSDLLAIVEQSTRNQSGRIADTITEMDNDGATIKDIQSKIKQMIDTRGSWRKGLTGVVTTAAFEGAKYEVYSKGRSKITKTWNTEDDERVRESHRWLDGDTKQSHQLFHAGVTMLRYPGDPLGLIEEVANCRCWLEWNIR